MTISSYKRKSNSKASNNLLSSKNLPELIEYAPSEVSSLKKAKTSPTLNNTVSNQDNKKYRKFKKMFEKTSMQKRQAQANTIQARKEFNNSRKRHSFRSTVKEANVENAEKDEKAHNNNFNNEEHFYYQLSYSRDNYRLKKEIYSNLLADLKAKLDFVKEIGINTTSSSNRANETVKVEYLDQLKNLEQKAEENQIFIQKCREKYQQDIEHQCKLDQKQAQREFQKKRFELKKKLINKYEETRKQLETDQMLLDISMGLYEMSKLPRTRNLRKRINTNARMYQFDYSIDWLNLDAAAKSISNTTVSTASTTTNSTRSSASSSDHDLIRSNVTSNILFGKEKRF